MSWLSRLFGGNPTAPPSAQLPAFLSDTPDQPQPFGFKVSWLAIRSADPAAVIAALDLTNVQAANWVTGVAAAIASRGNPGPFTVFVTPPLNGWTLVIGGLNLIDDLDDRPGGLRALLYGPSVQFGAAQLYGSYRVVDHAGWAVAENGHVTRAFAYSDGTFHLNEGAMTQAERDLGLGDINGLDVDHLNTVPLLFDDPDQPDDPGAITRMPQEDDPAQLAGVWSVNPLLLGGHHTPSTGWCGTMTQT